MAFTVGRALKWWAWEKPDRVALNYQGEEITFAELYSWGSKVAAWLAGQGVGPGDRVMMVGENSLEYAMLIVGCTIGNVISSPITFRSSERELRRALGLLTPTLLFCDAPREAICGEALGDERTILRPLEQIRALRSGPEATVIVEYRPEDPLFIIGTSGSTGAPKGVIYTHGSTMAYAAEFAIMEPAAGNGGSILVTGPYSSASGTLCTLQSLAVGATVYAENKFDPARALEILVDHKVTTFLAATVFYERIAALPDFEDADLSSIKFAQISGARVSPALIERFIEKGVVLRQAYGCTEAGGAWAARDETALTAPEKCGPGALFSEYKVVHPDGSPAAPGEAGEILVRSAGLAAGYWNDPEQTARTFVDGWLHTADRGVQDERGNLTFLDRMKDIIISGGLNISAMEVENTIAELDGVDEVVVIAAKDEDFGETPLAIVHGDLARIEATTILAHCREALASYKIPRYVAFEAEPLPRLTSGKIAKVELREKYKDAPSFLERIR